MKTGRPVPRRQPMQLNKYLALCGVASRRRSNQYIAEGRVRVNDRIIRGLGHVIDPEKDRVTLDRQPVTMPRKFVYYLLNKPGNVITSASDPRGRRTVLELVPSEERIFPVGRLDFDTEGVLLLTNDGYLAYRLAHPRYVIDKVYEAWVSGRMDGQDVEKLGKGVFINPGVRVRGDARILKVTRDRTLIQIRIHEGKKRQIKRMLKGIGYPVVYLKRTVFAGLNIRGLNSGKWRPLTAREVSALYRLTGLTDGGSR